MNKVSKGERNLIIAILTQAVKDALCFSNKSSDSEQQHARNRESALRFINPRDKAFTMYCDFADIDPQYFYEKFVKHYNLALYKHSLKTLENAA